MRLGDARCCSQIPESRQIVTTKPGATAIVTGAAKGIGRAVAEVLAADGVRVAVVDIDSAEGQQTVAQINDGNGESVFVEADVSTSVGAELAAEQAKQALGHISILINNAGIQRYGNVVEMPEDEWDKVLSTNLKSVFLMSKFCVPHILEQGSGAIVNVASVQGLAAQKGVAAYSASKGGTIALTRAMAVDFAPQIRVNCVLPGSVDTPMLRTAANLFADVPEDAVEKWGNMHPLGRVAQPEEIARVVAFLAGPGASFMTGAAILVDGGLLSVIGGT